MLVEVTKAETSKVNLSTAQKTFKRLCVKIKNLQEQLKASEKTLDQALDYYHETLSPALKQAGKLDAECIKKIYNFYHKSAHSFSKHELQALKKTLCNQLTDYFDAVPVDDFDEELCEISKVLKGADPRQEYEDSMSAGLEDLQEYLKSQGADVDFSNINGGDGMEEIMRKIQETVIDSLQSNSEAEPAAKPKSKQQTIKEQKAEELANMQKKGLTCIYRELAKIIHPDLEQDITLKKEKEEVMKQASVAYENNDLHTLLMLQIDWINKADSIDGITTSDETLKVYNSILKTQVDEVQRAIEVETYNSKYFVLAAYTHKGKNPITQMKSKLKVIHTIMEDCKNKLTLLLKPNAISELKKALQQIYLYNI